ncbi:MAG: oxidoreductase [Alphaproteobacteria bacterium]|nr:MAG: oxidoreductase [Alphaproteobacteria bacterium]
MAAVGLLGTASAGQLPAPSAEPILTITGNVAVTNANGGAAFDLDLLKGLPATTFTTTTIWTDAPHSFTGVPLATLLDAVGARGEVVHATAINDYSIEIPVAAITADAPVVTYLMDGKPMSVRDKGPLWILYPFDDKPEYRTEVNYSRSIWQLDRLEIED